MPVEVDGSMAGQVGEADRLELLAERVDEALVDATARSAIDKTVCEELAAATHCQFATVFCHDEGVFTFRTALGIDGETARGLVPLGERGPAQVAVETGRTQVVSPEEGHPWHHLVSSHDVGSIAVVPVGYDGEVWRVLLFGDARTDVYGVHERDVLDGLGSTVGHAIDALQQRKQARTLEYLQSATTRLGEATTPAEVFDIAVEAARQILDVPGVGVFAFDSEENVLKPATATDELLEYYGGTTVFGPSAADGEVWRAYTTGERRVFRDIRTAERAVNDSTDARSVLLEPLGSDAVFVIATTVPGTFDTREQKLVDTLLSTTKAALDRVESAATVERQRGELTRQRRQLERLERTSDIVREVNRVLVRAGSRSELEEEVCDQLTGDEGFTFAFIGEVPPDSDVVEPRVWSGDPASYLDETDLSLSGEDREPAAEAAATEQRVGVDVTANLQGSTWAAAATEAGFQSACAVPLVHDATVYGVLGVYASDRDAFAQFDGILTELGETIGYGINVTETRQGILADSTTELSLSIPGADTFMNRVASTVDEPVVYYELTPEKSASTRLLFALSDPPIEALRDLEAESVGVESLTAVSSGGEYVFRVTVANETVASALLSCGAIPQEVTARPERTEATVRLPQELGVRAFLDRFRERFPGTEMRSRRSVEQPARTRREFRADVDAELTERQLEVLQVAYESGFFESPRETTGAELSELLGVSQPTVSRHLREGQRRVFALLFEQ